MSPDAHGSKVANMVEKYDLPGKGDELETKWTGENGSRTSLRDLADEFNRSILESAMIEADTMSSLDIDRIYRVLTKAEGSDADLIRQQRELERRGIDVENILNDFVTHQTIYTYLTKYRDAELDNKNDNIANRKIEVIQRLNSRVAAVSESSLQTLINADEVTDHEYKVLVDIQTVCSDCGASYPITTLIQQGGCSCSKEEGLE